MNNIIVQKFGGTSVGDTDKIKKIAQKVVKEQKKGNKMVVVVSAMGKTTNALVAMAGEISDKPSSREMDMLLSTGEQVTIALLAMAIENLGEKVISLTGHQAGIQTDDRHKKARIEAINSDRMSEELEAGNIVIVAGFQGVSKDGNITTLGRGGSDTSAVALACALEADKCEIYTDVPGVFTTDPRKVKEAKMLDEISYDEMLELAKLGAKVLHPRSVELARKYDLPLVVKSTFEEGNGTMVTGVKSMERVLVRGVTVDENIARVTVTEVPDHPGTAFKLFSQLSKNNVPVDMIIQNLDHNGRNDISFTVQSDEAPKAKEIASTFLEDVSGDNVLIKENVSKLSIVGTGITGSADVASKLFEVLYNEGVNIEMISTSELKISCLIEKEAGHAALNAIHDAFELGL